MPFTAEEKVRIRHHCGFLNVAEAYTFVLGTPSSVETQFIIEGALDRVLEAAMFEARRIVRILDKIEGQMDEDLELLAVTELGEIGINQKEQSQLTDRYDYWVASLCNLLGIERNPFDKRLATRGVNVSVMG
jgi:hypothetical protein